MYEISSTLAQHSRTLLSQNITPSLTELTQLKMNKTLTKT